MVNLKDLKLKCCKAPSSIPILLTLEYIKPDVSPKIEWSPSTSLEIPENPAIKFSSTNSICRFLARISAGKLYGSTILEKTETDHWLEFSSIKYFVGEFNSALEKLNRCLQTSTYLVGHHITLADISVWSMLINSKQWPSLCQKKLAPKNVLRWFNHLAALAEFITVSQLFPDNFKQFSNESSDCILTEKTKTADKGKFVDLPGAEMGKVIVRFPPEASGFLHIGHAKAALLNSHYQTNFQGKLIMRFDDTNPEKEKEDFEKVILEDVSMLEIKPDIFTCTSDHFDLILEKCEFLLKKGLAYVDDTDPEAMKKEREQKIESKNRSNSVEKNFSMWEQMKLATAYGTKCCVRAKIDMASDNGCLRDPTLYRCKAVPHPKTGQKFKVYPTYDFACPIVDSVEGVTHALRTTEYHDRDDQYFWVLDSLNLRKPHIYEYSRLNMTNTVLSKRKLTWFVEQGIVDSWEDPRMPTVRGVLRRGMTVEGLKQFIVAQGSSRSVVMMEWDKIWAFNRKVIDPITRRYNAVESEKVVPVYVEGISSPLLEVAWHPKDSTLGTRNVHVGSKLLVDQGDATAMRVGEDVTFINWGNMLIQEIIKNENGDVTKVVAKLNLENKDFKKTLKTTWVADLDNPKLIPCVCMYYEHLISKAVLGKDDDFKSYLNQNTKITVNMLGDPDLALLKKGDIIQIQRKGFFICDFPYDDSTVRHTSREMPVVLISIPDGSKDTATLPNAVKVVREKKESSKELLQRSKGKSSEKSPQDEHRNFIAGKTDADTVSSLDDKIVHQGEKIRKLKADKISKAILDPEIKSLLELKARYKEISGIDWKPNSQKAPAKSSISDEPNPDREDLASLDAQIAQQGDKIRKLKLDKVPKATLDPEINALLELKARYNKISGTDWKPNSQKTPAESSASSLVNSGSKDLTLLDVQIVQQGDKIRKLKLDKVPKAALDPEIKILLELKSKYKLISGSDWQPGSLNQSAADSSIISVTSSDGNINSLNTQITKQGDKIRKLKSDKVSKAVLDPEVKILLELKSQYKKISGVDWQPNSQDKSATNISCNESVANASFIGVISSDSGDINSLNTQIMQQGDKIRKLKTDKVSKAVLDPEIKILLELKSRYKKVSGVDWQPNLQNQITTNITSAEIPSSNNENTTSLDNQIKQQEDKIRKLKSDKVGKAILDPEVKLLLEFKRKYKEFSGKDWPNMQTENKNSDGDKRKSNMQSKKKDEIKAQDIEQKNVSEVDTAQSGVKKITRLGLEAKKEENLAEWYSQVITKGEMIEYYDVSGCYILRPWAFGIWEAITNFFDPAIKALGVSNCYFPMFVSSHALEREKTHIADFAPEVAWVTKSGSSDLAEPVAIRPTSETVMYPSYAKWIKSYRDLPLQLNQWCSVVRWEFKHPQPFIRTREFLWQEGHTAFATREEAVKEVYTILDLYAKIYEDLLAIPVIPGRKSEKEKFAGADFTTTVEAYVPANGRAIQGATSHHLGQNFSKMFEIIFEDPETGEKQYVFQNSWGLTTRTIGVIVMVHGDNCGLVLPPRVAPHQVVIVPCGITVNLSESERKSLMDKCESLEEELRLASIRVKGDFRENYSPGWKYNHWELKGVPLRIELGPRDVKKGEFVAVRRDTGEKITEKISTAACTIKKLLDDIHQNLFSRAKAKLNEHLVISYDFDDFCTKLDNRCLIQAPFCGEMPCEDVIKKDSAKNADELLEPGAPSMGAKTLCIPFEQPGEIKSDMKCINPQCKNRPQYFTLFGRSY